MSGNLSASPGEFERELRQAVEEMTVTPYELVWLYVRAARERHKGNIVHTANGIGVYRRTLQRLLRSSRPKRVEPQS